MRMLLRYTPKIYYGDASDIERMRRTFEYDPDKSTANLRKHGVDFERAKRLWDDPRALRISLSYEGEDRYLVTGVMDGKQWTAICTDRGANIRIISCRRAHKKEEEAYADGNL